MKLIITMMTMMMMRNAIFVLQKNIKTFVWLLFNLFHWWTRYKKI